MGSRRRPKPPAATAQEKAFARRTETAVDKEIDEENRRKRLLLRNTLGTNTLLSGFKASGGQAQFSGTSFTSNSGAPSTGGATSRAANTPFSSPSGRGRSLLDVGGNR